MSPTLTLFPPPQLQEVMSARWKEKPPMAEDNSSGSSGSPTPGDTLPWNLPKHQRTKRTKATAGGNGSVLDPAERAVLRIAGRRGGWQAPRGTWGQDADSGGICSPLPPCALALLAGLSLWGA